MVQKNSIQIKKWELKYQTSNIYTKNKISSATIKYEEIKLNINAFLMIKITKKIKWVLNNKPLWK